MYYFPIDVSFPLHKKKKKRLREKILLPPFSSARTVILSTTTSFPKSLAYKKNPMQPEGYVGGRHLPFSTGRRQLADRKEEEERGRKDTRQ